MTKDEFSSIQNLVDDKKRVEAMLNCISEGWSLSEDRYRCIELELINFLETQLAKLESEFKEK